MDSYQFANRLRQCSQGDLSIGALEEWLDSSSWNVHMQPNEALTDAVFEFEELYSVYCDGRIENSELQGWLGSLADALTGSAPIAGHLELANTIGPFESRSFEIRSGGSVPYHPSSLVKEIQSTPRKLPRYDVHFRKDTPLMPQSPSVHLEARI